MGPVVGEYVFGLARPIQAEVTPGAPEAPGARDERLRISTRDPLRERDPPSKFAAPDSLHLSRNVGDRPEEDQPNHAPIAGAGRVVEHLVGAGGVPGKDDTAVAALDGKGDHRSDVLDALAEPLEGRAGEVLAPAGDDIVAAVVELEVRDARGVEPSRQLPDQRLPGGERRPEAVHPDEGRAPPAAPRLGDDAVEPDAVASAEADERDGDAGRFPQRLTRDDGPGRFELRQVFEVMLGEVAGVGLDRQRAPGGRCPDPLPVALAETFQERDGPASNLAEGGEILAEVPQRGLRRETRPTSG